MASADISSIWDEPAIDAVTRASTILHDEDDSGELAQPAAAKTRRSTLFLSSDSEGEVVDVADNGTARSSKNKPSKGQPDIEALFADLDDDTPGDPDIAFQELAPSLDLDALRREAEARHARALASRPNPLLPSSSFGDIADKDGEKDGRKAGKDGEKEKPKRKPLPKLDEARLLGPDGFPALLKQAKGFKPRGKGHEISDLNRLLQVYQFWSHKMYPKTHFRDTVQRVEKLCHSKRMHVALTVWRDEANGLINGRAQDQPVDLTSDAESDHENNASRRSSSRPAGADNVPREQDDRSSSAPPTRPPSSPSNNDDIPDDFDIDALLREEEAMAHASTSMPPALTGVNANVNVNTNPDDELWDELMQDLPTEPHVPSALPPQSSSPPVAVGDEDEEMWDIVREMEQSSSAHGIQKTTAGPSDKKLPTPQENQSPAQEASVPEPPEPVRATNDEGWDEMYL